MSDLYDKHPEVGGGGQIRGFSVSVSGDQVLPLRKNTTAKDIRFIWVTSVCPKWGSF